MLLLRVTVPVLIFVCFLDLDLLLCSPWLCSIFDFLFVVDFSFDELLCVRLGWVVLVSCGVCWSLDSAGSWIVLYILVTTASAHACIPSVWMSLPIWRDRKLAMVTLSSFARKIRVSLLTRIWDEFDVSMLVWVVVSLCV